MTQDEVLSGDDDGSGAQNPCYASADSDRINT